MKTEQINYLLILLLTAVLSTNSQQADFDSQYFLHYWPMPQNLESNSFNISENIQLIGKYMTYQLVNHQHNRDLQIKINDIFDLYFNKLFHLSSLDQEKAYRMQNVKDGKNLFNATYNETDKVNQPIQQGELKVFINITNASDYETENYTLKINNKAVAIIESPGYTGFVRAIQTLSQSVIFIQNNQTFQLQNLPINIIDWAEFQVRGIMLDCSSSFIQIPSLKEYIDAMMFNKLNTLVMNVIGLGPIRLSISNKIQKYETYNNGELMDLILYGKIRGVKVILGIESQAGYQFDGDNFGVDVICKTDQMPLQGQLNLTNNNSQWLLRQVVEKAGKISEDMIYVGGREVNISTQKCGQDNTTGRYLACQYLKEMYPEKKCLVYIEGNSENRTAIASNIPEDSLQIIGLNSNENQNLQYKSIMINHQLNLNDGVGPSWTTHSQTLINWPSYSSQYPRCSSKEFCMGGLLLLEHQTGLSIGVRTWIRATLWAEALWNIRPNESLSHTSQLRRLARMERRLNQWGVRNAPFTCEYCTLNMWDCF